MDMEKQNCWEVLMCGREPGGAKVSEKGECPAATETRHDGVNSGKNAGRACWVVAGTLCKGEIQGDYAKKILNCTKCHFYEQVVKEEGPNYESTRDIMRI